MGRSILSASTHDLSSTVSQHILRRLSRRDCIRQIMFTFIRSSPEGSHFKPYTPTQGGLTLLTRTSVENVPSTSTEADHVPVKSASSSLGTELDFKTLTGVLRPSLPEPPSAVTSITLTVPPTTDGPARPTSVSELPLPEASYTFVETASYAIEATSTHTNLTVPGEPVPTSASEASQNKHNGPRINNGATAAIVVGIVVLFIAIAYATWVCRRKICRRKHPSPDFSSLASSYEHALPMDDLKPPRPPEWQHRKPTSPDFSTLAAPYEHGGEINDMGPKGPPDSPSIGLDTWLSHHGAGDPRTSVWSRIQSPSPQPAVAEVQSFTRTRQKPVVCDIGSMRPTIPDVSPVPDEASGHGFRDEPVGSSREPAELATPHSWHGMATPLTPTGEFAPTWPYQEGYPDRTQSSRPEWDRRWH